jgi:hypothetical protein
MIGEYTLTTLLEKYQINSSNLINKNNNILTYGEYAEIDRTLAYLKNELKIDSKSIEKCPSILYLNVNAIKSNVLFLKEKDISFSNIETCLHVLSTEPKGLQATYNYVKENYGLSALNKITSILSIPVARIKELENLKISFTNKNDVLSVAIGQNSIETIRAMLLSPEYKEHPDLFTSTTLAHSNIENIRAILSSPEYKEHPDLFTSETLAHSNIEAIRAILSSPEYKEHPDLFTSTTLAHSNIEAIRAILLNIDFNNISFLQYRSYKSNTFEP